MKRLFLLLAACSACETTPSAHNNSLRKQGVAHADTTIILSKNLKLVGQRAEEYNGAPFGRISILANDRHIFIDSVNLYWLAGFSSAQYPKFLKCGNTYQLLLEVDKRPNQNELTQILITDDSHVVQTPLPILDWNPQNLDSDKKLELFGILTNGETTAANGDTAFYNPTLVYELVDDCLTLDTSTTQEVNTRIWGRFHGYTYNDSLLLPFNRSQLLVK